MGYRKFVDSAGNAWEIRDQSRSEWVFLPVSGNPNSRRTVSAPGYEKDPYELSDQELQTLLDSTGGTDTVRRDPTRSPKSPFLD